ncbi:MAG: multicopper oxidase domain-containing protein [Proteobacteria bacterium]|nr:multicopper oxidase domain-containing protein [Pseudomonadota bacterium]
MTSRAASAKVEQWTIESRSTMDHPFHLHGASSGRESYPRRRNDGRAVPCMATP